MTAPGPAADGGGGAEAAAELPAARPTGDAVRRAERLLRWYPRTWRDRYGEEFAELLVSRHRGAAASRPAVPWTSRAAASSPGSPAPACAASRCALGRRGHGDAPGRSRPASVTSPPAWSRLAAASAIVLGLRRRDVVPADHRLAVVRRPAASGSAAALATVRHVGRDARPCSSSRCWPRCRCSPRWAPASPAAGRAACSGRRRPRHGQRDRDRRRAGTSRTTGPAPAATAAHPQRAGRVRAGRRRCRSLVLGAPGACSPPSPPPRCLDGGQPARPGGRGRQRRRPRPAGPPLARGSLAFETRLAAAACAVMTIAAGRLLRRVAHGRAGRHAGSPAWFSVGADRRRGHRGARARAGGRRRRRPARPGAGWTVARG